MSNSSQTYTYAMAHCKRNIACDKNVMFSTELNWHTEVHCLLVCHLGKLDQIVTSCLQSA